MTLPRIAVALIVLTSLAFVVASAAAGSPQPAAAPDFGAVDSYVDSQMKENHIPGLALAIVQGDQVVYLKGYGVADPSGRPVTPQTPFAVASLVKPMTALAVMQLVEEDKLELDAPVRTYLPWFRVADETASSEITLRHLLYHTSGIPGTAGLEYAGEQDLRADAIERRVRSLQGVELDRPVGETYEYSNSNYQVLGMVMQQLTGGS